MKIEDIVLDEKTDEAVYRQMFQFKRSDWINIIRKFITSMNPVTKKIEELNGYCINGYPEMFTELYQGKYNIGDYVTTKRGGKYRIIYLQYLDNRWSKYWDRNPENPFVDSSRIDQFGCSYSLAGIDDKGKMSGTEYYMLFEYGIQYGVDLLLHDSYEDCLTPINPTDKEKEEINKAIIKAHHVDSIEYLEDRLKEFSKHSDLKFPYKIIEATLKSNLMIDFKEVYNIGDYITTKYGGMYRIINIPYLDIRWKDNWINNATIDIWRVRTYGNSYVIVGFDKDGKPFYNDYYLYDNNSKPIPHEIISHIDLSEENKDRINNLIIKLYGIKHVKKLEHIFSQYN